MAKFGLSQSLRRIEDPRLLKGGGSYTDDIRVAGEVQGVVLRSPHAMRASRKFPPRPPPRCPACWASTPPPI